MDTSKDIIERRCPRLGHSIPFKYCRTSGTDKTPCWKIADCWWEHFDIAEYLQQNYPPSICRHIATAQPPSKITSLVELIQQAQQRIEKDKHVEDSEGA